MNEIDRAVLGDAAMFHARLQPNLELINSNDNPDVYHLQKYQ